MKASQKFLVNHPKEHKLFVSIVGSANNTNPTRRQLWPREEDINGEQSNMEKNQDILQFRQEDLLEEQKRKEKKTVCKTVSWSETLLDVHVIENPTPLTADPDSNMCSDEKLKKQLALLPHSVPPSATFDLCQLKHR